MVTQNAGLPRDCHQHHTRTRTTLPWRLLALDITQAPSVLSVAGQSGDCSTSVTALNAPDLMTAFTCFKLPAAMFDSVHSASLRY